jgi:hypothetical protein
MVQTSRSLLFIAGEAYPNDLERPSPTGSTGSRRGSPLANPTSITAHPLCANSRAESIAYWPTAPKSGGKQAGPSPLAFHQISGPSALKQQSASSIFETVIKIFHDLILEGDHACLCLPPFCASVLRRFKRRDLELHRASSKFTIKDPPHTASGKNFGWDGNP